MELRHTEVDLATAARVRETGYPQADDFAAQHVLAGTPSGLPRSRSDPRGGIIGLLNKPDFAADGWKGQALDRLVP